MRKLLQAGVLAGAAAIATGAAAQPVLRLNTPMDPPHMNPILYQENVSFRILSDIYEGFVSSTPDGGNVPALATSWTALDGGRHGFRFTLRDGVRFHTGRPFTARDVKATFEMMLDPKWKAG